MTGRHDDPASCTHAERARSRHSDPGPQVPRSSVPDHRPALGSPEDAQDVLQDSFIRASRSSSSFTEKVPFTPGFTGSPSTSPSATIANGGTGRPGRHPPRSKGRLTAEPADSRPENDPSWSLERVEREWRPSRRPSISLGPTTGRWSSSKISTADGTRRSATCWSIPVGTVRSRLHRGIVRNCANACDCLVDERRRTPAEAVTIEKVVDA